MRGQDAPLFYLHQLNIKKLTVTLIFVSSSFFNAESDVASNVSNPNTVEEALVEAKLQLEKEEEELEKAISGIATQVSSIASVPCLYLYICAVINNSNDLSELLLGFLVLSFTD